MLDRFRKHLAQSGLIPEGSSVLVGYSGGADSTCLLHLLREVCIDVAAGHLHHGQRAEADQELKLCEAFCQELGIPFLSGRADVPRMSKDMKIGLEEAGRHARYAFLKNAAFRLQCGLIATAHTQSDHVETVLLNLTRGSGLHGLGGIPARRDNIVRPLLAFSRDETRAYCDERGLWYHDDPANADISFSRARVRHRVLKELRAINPSVDVAITRTAEIAGEEDGFLNGMAAAALEQSELALNGDLRFLTIDCEAAFDRHKLGHLPPVLFKRACRLAVEALGAQLDYGQTEALLSLSDKGSVTAEEGKVVIEWTPDTLTVRRLDGDTLFRHPITVPGETISDDFGWTITAALSGALVESDRRGMTAAIDPKKLKGQLYFRTAQPGDQMQPLGFEGHRKLADLLSDAKLTRAARTRLPIICDMVGPIWAPGVCLSGRVAATSGTGNVLLLQFGPTSKAESDNEGNVG